MGSHGEHGAILTPEHVGGSIPWKFGDEPNMETKRIIFQVNQQLGFCWGVYPESDQTDVPRNFPVSDPGELLGRFRISSWEL